MCRRSSVILAGAAALLLAFGARGDEVEAFLERHGLFPLLAVHLESQLETARGDQREIIVGKLADLYAELLEGEPDEAEREHLEARGRALIASLPDHHAGALRLALLRGSYRTAERIAENHRLRLSDEAELEHARALLSDIIPRFNQLRRHLQNEIELLERRLTRASGLEATNLFSDVEQARALHDECTFFTAWALYYQSWIHDRRDNAMVAIQHFSELLDLESANPDPNDVSVDLRSMEAIARSILGIALCKSLTSTGATAVNWISLLESDNTFEAIRAEAPIWRIAIWLEHGEFVRARDELVRVLDSGREIPLPWLRIVAVHALESGQRDRHADALARYAVTQLASRDALDQVLDIARRYGTESLGDDGFALLYVRGVMTYSEASDRHDSELPATDTALIELFAQAGSELETALDQDDVDEYPDATTACRRLIGYCHYFQGRFLDARDSFEAAAGALRFPEEAAEALWMAVVCLDRVVQARRTSALAGELDLLMNRFLREHPSSAYAPKIMLKQAMASDEATDDLVDTLLEIPENSDVYPAARRRAAQSLYQLFRAARGERKHGYARRCLDIALPIMAESMRRIGEPGTPTPFELVIRCRMLLEVALSDGVLRLAAARQVFAWLDELAASHGSDLSPHRDELDYRRLLERLHGGDVAAATVLADELWQRQEDSIWTRLGSRALFNHGLRAWRTVTDEQVVPETLHLVDRYGGRILLETAGDPQAMQDQMVLGYHATVAEAARLLWERTRDEQRGRAALTLYERLLRERPTNASFLRATALLSEKLEKPEQALDCWRTILSGSDVRSESWFEAKFHQIALLIVLDRPAHARDVLEQHLQLNPDYGPDPWGARLKGLEAQLDRSPAAGDDSGVDAP